ncbi:MAG: type II toxin-antitoxin system Phd/YefM family antitoxin [Deltaproteobacteria bacterium]|nr:type II toxin-antitoxin system Phd/YefM family antitoxin [Deltaproteobacteria bacterium]
MPQQVSYGNIEEDILKVLDEGLSTGVPVEIERKGKRLLISPAKKRRDLDRLEKHPDFILGNPDDLIHMDWSSEWHPQL